MGRTSCPGPYVPPHRGMEEIQGQPPRDTQRHPASFLRSQVRGHAVSMERPRESEGCFSGTQRLPLSTEICPVISEAPPQGVGAGSQDA